MPPQETHVAPGRAGLGCILNSFYSLAGWLTLWSSWPLSSSTSTARCTSPAHPHYHYDPHQHHYYDHNGHYYRHQPALHAAPVLDIIIIIMILISIIIMITMEQKWEQNLKFLNAIWHLYLGPGAEVPPVLHLPERAGLAAGDHNQEAEIQRN